MGAETDQGFVGNVVMDRTKAGTPPVSPRFSGNVEKLIQSGARKRSIKVIRTCKKEVDWRFVLA